MLFAPRLWPSGLYFLFNSERIPKYVQNLYKSYTSPATNNRISPPIFPPRSVRKRAPAAPQFPPIFDQKCNIPTGTFFCNIFRPFLPLFLSGQEPQKQKCYTFAENATLARPLSGAPPHRRPFSHQNDELASPGKAVQIREVRVSLPALTIQMAQRSASQNCDEPSYASTTDKTTASPQFELRQGNRLLSLLSTPLSPRLCSHSESGMRPGSTAVPPPKQS